MKKIFFWKNQRCIIITALYEIPGALSKLVKRKYVSETLVRIEEIFGLVSKDEMSGTLVSMYRENIWVS